MKSPKTVRVAVAVSLVAGIASLAGMRRRSPLAAVSQKQPSSPAS